MRQALAAKTNRPHTICERPGCAKEVGWFCWTAVDQDGEYEMTSLAVIHEMPVFCSEEHARG
jgi:hypothetical protein